MLNKTSHFYIVFSLNLIASILLLPMSVAAADLSGLSTRGEAGPGEDQMIMGIDVEGTDTRQFLIGALGPTLRKSGVSNVLNDPEFTLFNQRTGEAIASCDNWQSCPGADIVENYLQATGQSIEDNEAAMVINLGPGSYTANIQGADGGSGITLGSVIDLANSPVLEIKSGEWIGPNFTVCFNVSSDATKLTTVNSTCSGGAALTYNLIGITPLGFACGNSATVLEDIAIIDGRFSWQETRANDVNFMFSGIFNLSNSASGTSKNSKEGEPNLDCNAEWTAAPLGN